MAGASGGVEVDDGRGGANNCWNLHRRINRIIITPSTPIYMSFWLQIFFSKLLDVLASCHVPEIFCGSSQSSSRFLLNQSDGTLRSTDMGEDTAGDSAPDSYPATAAATWCRRVARPESQEKLVVALRRCIWISAAYLAHGTPPMHATELGATLAA